MTRLTYLIKTTAADVSLPYTNKHDYEEIEELNTQTLTSD